MKTLRFLAVLVVLALPTFSLMVRSGIFTMHDPHLFRMKEFDQCIKDRVFPCRWAADSGKGYGEPLFNYYAQFPYWLTELVHFTGLSLLDSAKIVYGLSLLLSGFTMFLLARKYWGNKGGLVSAVFYLYAPYRSVDVWVRGALPEALSFVLYPLLIYFLDLYLEKHSSRYLLLLAMSLALLITTHNLSVFMFLPFLGLYWLIGAVHRHDFSGVPGLVLVGIIALGLSAYYLLPVLAENKFIDLGSTVSGYYDFHIHFATLNELFISRFWGYGASLWAKKFLSISIGQLHWILPLVIICLGFILKKHNFSFLTFCLLGVAALFLTHGKSSVIWNLVPLMKYIQFPWRFLGPALFFLSLASGYAVSFFNWPGIRLWPVLLILLVILINYNFFRPDIWRNITDKEQYSGPLWDEGRSSSLTDFWPRSAPQPPADFAPVSARFISGDGLTVSAVKKSSSADYLLDVSRAPAVVSLPITYFPGWHVLVDGRSVASSPSGLLGLTSFRLLDPGFHQIYAVFSDTWPRSLGNYISLFSLLLSPLCLLKRRIG